MANQRTRGHNFERRIMKRFKDLGYDSCLTTRNGSRFLDNCKLDLMNIPYRVQCKYGAHRGLSYSKLIEDMEKLTKKTEYADLPIVIFHTKDGRRKSTKLVVMPEDHYFDIISELKTLKEKQNRELSSSVPED